MFSQMFHVFKGNECPDAQAIKQILEIGSQFKEQSGTVNTVENASLNNDLRRSEIRWIPWNHPQISQLIWHYINLANRESFGYDLKWISDIQLTTYQENNKGFYDWHHDCFVGNGKPFQRKLSFVMQLSDPWDYEGGEFYFHSPGIGGDWDKSQADSIKAKGTIIVFPSFLVHKVTPVTKGKRQSLVSWIEGPHFT